MDDLEFVQSCLKGDKRSWDEFLARYSRLIYNYIYSVLAAKGRSFPGSQVDDIFQELFHSLLKDNYRKLATYRGRNGCSLASWLRQVTVNFTIDYLRRLKPAISIDAENEEGFSLKDILVDLSPEAADFLIKQEKLKTLYECIDSLENAERYFMELLLGQGLNLDQIKGHLKISRGAADMRKSRIMQKLHECFRKKGFGLDFVK